MLRFRFTDNLHEVVYADLLRIRGKVCLIMGSGKSTTGTGAMHGDDGLENIIATDFVRLSVTDGILHGLYDPGMFGEFANPESPVGIDLAIFLGAEGQAIDGSLSAAIRLSPSEFCELAAWHVANFQPRSGAAAAFAAQAMGGSQPLPIDPEQRLDAFEYSISAAIDLPKFFLPFTVDHAERIAMLDAIIDQL